MWATYSEAVADSMDFDTAGGSPTPEAFLSAVRPVLDFIDTSRTACVVALGQFLDLRSAPAVGPDDLAQLMLGAFEAGDVPIGPLAYTSTTPTVACSEDGGSLSAYTERSPGEIDVLEALRLEPRRVVVAGARYGWLPGVPRASSHVMLCDLEAILIEVQVYLHRRAELLNYRGRARVTVGVHTDLPQGVTLRRLDEETGELHPDGLRTRRFWPLSTEFALIDPPQRTRRRSYRLATRAARAFGASAPQLLADPDGLRSDDLPLLAR